MNEEIQVPIIEITDGWTVDEIETEDDCDDAFAVLTALVVSIEDRMDRLEEAGNGLTPEYRHAKRALRWKKAALSVVNTKRGRIRREIAADGKAVFVQAMLNYVAAAHPKVMEEAKSHANAGLEFKGAAE